ncbi:type II R/M system DNA methylase [Williamsoniiplasma somnilux]|uniref:site-specific DNA-methyltransferase (cytosine-N(4)-specific) n=1 Tax=Williamsoniiplasma somnilux TaxID=215578 RepID=A0A2K8NZ49_9MOLU|nr:DNA methyltransferase [Williamsoniiplasma somnilux]ATZ19067.1 type II R/M system DNA methylase [Williamsoniiplasma somnilux]
MDSNIVIKESYNLNFKLIKSLDLTSEVKENWKNKSRMWGDKTHRISSYVAMFSPALANYFIKEYSEENDIILDTFSGRGTTLLQARLDNRKAYAIDLNPFAYVLSKSKSRSFKIQDILSRINELEEEYNKSFNNYKWNKDLEIYYSRHNLKQISFIKEKLGLKWHSLSEIDNYILAITLGIMHGPMRKNGETLYLSLHMSNHTSMSKNYVKKYAKEKKLKKPKDNVFEKIKNRAKFIILKSKYSDNVGIVKYGNALEIYNYFPNLKPKLVFTSPPYLNIINYTNQNWLKMWLLGFDTKEKNKSIGLNDDCKLYEYKNFMKSYLLNISKISSINTTIILVIGDVRNSSFKDIWSEIKEGVPELVIKEIYIDPIKQTNKATNSMGSKAGKATRIDRIYVFKKVNL